MTLSPRVGGATSQPTDASPSPAGQRYASNTCVRTKMTYEFFNELINIFLQAQTAYGVTNVPNDTQALKKILDALRTGGFNFTTGTVTASGTVTTPTVGLTGGYEITSPQNINIIVDNNNNETGRGFFVFNHSTDPANTLMGVTENGQIIAYSSGQSGINILDLAPTAVLAKPFMTFNRCPTKDGAVTEMGLIGYPLDTNEEFHIRSRTSGKFVIYSNADVDIHLDDDNNGANSFNILNGSDVVVFNAQENGNVNISVALNVPTANLTTTNTTNLNVSSTAGITTANITTTNTTTANATDLNVSSTAGITTANITTTNTTTTNTTDLNVSGTMTAQSKTVRAFTRAVCAVDASGNILAQKGVSSVTKTGTGTYRIVISESATSPYFTQATAGSGGADTTNINATTTDVRTYNTTPSLTDLPFLFEVFY